MNSSQEREIKECLLEIKNSSITLKLQRNVMDEKMFLKNINVIIFKAKIALDTLTGKTSYNND